jgi:hypothetical protein
MKWFLIFTTSRVQKAYSQKFREEMQLECSHPKNSGVLDGVVHFVKHLQDLSILISARLSFRPGKRPGDSHPKSSIEYSSAKA